MHPVFFQWEHVKCIYLSVLSAVSDFSFKFYADHYLQFHVLFMYPFFKFNVAVIPKTNYHYCTLLSQLNVTLNLPCDSAVFSYTLPNTQRKGT
jgi:hypothetical protein